jgi:hypothetical protein
MFDLGSAERNALDWCKALAIAAMQQSRRWAAGQTWWLGEVRGPCLQSLHAHQILIVTSAYHTRRALAIFRHRLPQYEWSVAAARRLGLSTDWWHRRAWAKTWLGETERFVWWKVVDRWRYGPLPR